MKREISQLSENDFCTVLTMLGYRNCVTRPAFSEWRRGKFHLFIRKKPKGKVVLSIHEDMPLYYPPFHKSRHKSRDLEIELAKIHQAYKRKRT